MRKTIPLLIWATAVASLWFVMRHWIPSGAERLYFLILPSAVVVTGILSPNGWSSSFTFAMRVMGGYVILTVLAAISVLPPVFKFGLAKEGIWLEVLWFSYFMATVCILLLSCYSGIVFVALRLLEIKLGERTQSLRAKRITVAVRLVATVLIFAAAVPYMLATFLVFRTKLPNVAAPERMLGHKVDDATFTTADGVTLKGWFVTAKNAESQRTLLVCHGVGSNHSNALIFQHVADGLNAHAFFFDFRGHGESAGHTTTLGHQEKYDVIAAIRYLRKHRPRQAREIIGLGQSMGAAALTRGAAEVKPPLNAVILDSGFASAVDVGDSMLAAFPPIMRKAMIPVGIPLASLHAGCWLPDNRPEDDVGSLRAPVLIIHARTDSLILPEHAHRLYAHAKQPKALWISDTDGHTSSAPLAMKEYIRQVRRLVDHRSTERVMAVAGRK